MAHIKTAIIIFIFSVFFINCDRVENPGQSELKVTPTGTGTYMISVDIGNGIVTSETGTSDSFAVVLSDPPTGDVTIPVSSGNNAEVLLSTGSLTFTSANWYTAQTVIVYGQNDTGATDGTQTVNINFGTVTSTDPNYNGVTHTALTAYNLDDDEPASVVILDMEDNIITGNGKTCPIVVVLNRQPSATVELNSITSTDTNAGNPNPNSISIDPADWSTPHVITVEHNIATGDSNFDIDLGTTTSTDSAFDGLTAGTIGIEKRHYVDVSNYSAGYTEPAGSYSSISGVGNIATLTPIDGIAGDEVDDGFAYLSIGFKFLYLGMPQEFIVVYTDGFASFSPQTFSLENDNNENLFNGNTYYTKILAPWWDDMDLTSGTIYYYTDNTLPVGSRVFTIEYNSITKLGTDHVYNFQIKLYEGTGVIEFIYGTASGTSGTTNASIGMKFNPDAIDGTGGGGVFDLGLADFQGLNPVKQFNPY